MADVQRAIGEKTRAAARANHLVSVGTHLVERFTRCDGHRADQTAFVPALSAAQRSSWRRLRARHRPQSRCDLPDRLARAPAYIVLGAGASSPAPQRLRDRSLPGRDAEAAEAPYCMSAIPGIGTGSCFGFSTMMQSVVKMRLAIEAAFCSPRRVTLVGSMIPMATRSPNSPVAAL